MGLCSVSSLNAMFTKFMYLTEMFIFLTLISSEVASINIQEDVHLIMTREEKQSIFGSDEKIPEYQLVELSKASPGIQRRSLQSDSGDAEDSIIIGLTTKDSIFHLILEREKYLALPAMKVEILDDGHKTDTIVQEHPKCLYRGSVANMEGSEVAISTCMPGEIKGFVHLTPNDQYILAPLPRRLQRDTVDKADPKLTNKHLLFKRNEDLQFAPNERKHFAKINEDNLETTEWRVSRATNGVKTVEVAVVVDDVMYTLLSHTHPEDPINAVTDLVFTILNGVQLLYDHPSLPVRIKIVLVYMKIITHPKVGPSKGDGDIFKYLQEFSNWQIRRNPEGDHNADHWDHAIMLSGLDLYFEKPESNEVVGLAWLEGMCDSRYSNTVNEGRNFAAVQVIAHEMGHNLGMQHDGNDNTCPDDKFIMSPSTGKGKTSWSQCSVNYIKKFLKRSQSHCLNDAAIPEPQMDYRSDLLPGQKYSSDDQCKLAIGKDSKMFIGSNAKFKDICSGLFCIKTRYMAHLAHPALDGTKCGNSKMCFRGACTDNNVIEEILQSNEVRR